MTTNETKFRSSKNTPLLQGKLFQALGQRAMTKTGDDILKGSFDSSTLDDGTRAFLDEVKIPSSVLSVPPVPAYISPSDHKEYWNRAKESTQSSMSQMDFSFYKTVVQDEELNEVTSKFIDIPFRSGYTPNRWKRSLNVHIMKKETDFRPEKQRTIHLIEASFSEGAKIIFSRRMMHNARLRKVIPEDQYARKGGKSIEAVLQKVLFYDYLRATRKPGVVVANDMASCYDRMVHSATSLALRSLGAPSPSVECMSGVIQNMQHYIRTAYGDSDVFYGGDPSHPLQGGGQGNPAAPPMWTALTIVFLRILNQMSPGVSILSPLSLLTVLFTAVYYVDNCDLFIMGDSALEDPSVTCMKMQRLLWKWCSILWVTGGVLRPDKCWWCLITFGWKNGKWYYIDKNSIPFTITAYNADKTLEAIRRSDPNTAELTLGVWCAPDGSWDKTFEVLKDKSVIWAECMRTSFLTQYESLLAICTTIGKTWHYPLGVTGLNKDQCKKIMTPAYKVILPKIGPSEKIPLEIRYAATTLFGLGLPEIYSQQGIEHVKHFLSHMNSGSKIGYTLAALLEHINIEIGCDTNIFHISFNKWGFLLHECCDAYVHIV